MLWSLVKIVAFLAVATALVFGLGWIIETPGEVRIAFGSREFQQVTDCGGDHVLIILEVVAVALELA